MLIPITYMITLSFRLNCSWLVPVGSCAIINTAPTMFFKLRPFMGAMFGGGGGGGGAPHGRADIILSN